MTKAAVILTLLISALLVLWPRPRVPISETPSPIERKETTAKNELPLPAPQTDTAGHEEALIEKLLVHAETNPTEAAQVLLDTTTPTRLQQTTLLGILQRLALRDPAAAQAWAQTFPEPERQEALDELHRLTKKLSPISPLDSL